MTYEEYCEIMDKSNFMIDNSNPYDMKKRKRNIDEWEIFEVMG